MNATMKKTILLFLLVGFCELSFSQTLTTPRPSPAAQLTQRIGLTDITINYSRPSVITPNADRTGQIWGGVVPYGLAPNQFGNQKDMPWRAGANENTTISFSTDVKINGKPLSAGKYGLHMIPSEDGTFTVIFSHNTSSWGSYWYEKSEDALRIEVESKTVPFTNVLTYEFISFGQDQGTLALSWEKKQIPITISVSKETILQSFRDQLRGATGFGWQGNFGAANYCLNNNINQKEALIWADRAIAANKNGQTMGLKAALLFQIGEKEKAIAVAEEAKDNSNEAQLNFLGYQMMGVKEYKKAEEYFKLNIKKNPKSANVYDSMGECYMAMNKNDEAIKMFKKSLANNPAQFIKANSIANLKKLGVEIEE